MRTVIAITALALSAAGAHAAEDRYGPPPTRALVAAAGVAGSAQAAQSLAPTPYAGRMLGWSGKIAPRAPAVEQPAAAAVAARPIPFQPQAPGIQPQPQQRAAALPQSLYDRPMAPAGAPQTVPLPRAAAAASLPPPPSAQRAQAPYGSAARAYSVIREFGGQPDPVTLPPPTSYWATRDQGQPVLSDPTYGEGLSKKDAESTPREGVGEVDIAPPPAKPKPKPTVPALGTRR